MRFLSGALLCFVLCAGPAGAEEESPIDCPIRALLAEDDAGLRRVYDGIRKGLEQAQLPRVCLDFLAPDDDDDAVLDRLAADPPPLLFVLGSEASRRLGGRLAEVPRVYVDTAWLLGTETRPEEPAPPAPAAVVRGVMSARRLGDLLLGLFPEHPWQESPMPVHVSWPLGSAADTAGSPGSAFREDARLELRGLADERGGGRALLHLRLGGGARPASLQQVLARAEALVERERERARGLPLISDDLAHWRNGAAVLVLPDHRLLGRVAANAGRELLEDHGRPVLHRTVHGMEVRVDLGAARAQGFEPPLPFLAGADVLRRGAPRRAPSPEDRR
ncbi:MAG: hypothetical protein ACYTG6_02065 [Planctomycetota bacterium]|jgi:hypothetical protein